MGFEKVKAYHFRNLQKASVDLQGKKNIFLVGPNGQGKTNFLELIYYLCFGSSFRTRSDQLICKIGENDFYCGSEFTTKSALKSRIDIKYQNKKKEIRLNKNPIYDRKELVYQIPCIVFCHEDIQFVNGQPERKRWFFDQTLSLKYPYYLDSLRNYRKILKERNAVLKSRKENLLEIYSVQLVKAGLELQKRRKEVIIWFNEYISDYFEEVSNISGHFELEYQPSWKNAYTEKEAFNQLEKKKKMELDKGLTLSGPHRDNFNMIYNGNNFIDTGSTGQMRLISLLLRIIQSRFFSEENENKPIFLLDDVLLEIDREKRERFLKKLPEYEQAFFTFLPGDDTYSEWENSLHLAVKDGVFY